MTMPIFDVVATKIDKFALGTQCDHYKMQIIQKIDMQTVS